MAISRFGTSSVAQGLPKYQKFWDGISTVIPYAFDSIATQVASGSATTITFNSIPTGYRYLQLHCHWAVPQGDTELLIRFNGDSGSSYTKHQIFANGTNGALSTSQSSLTSTTAIAGPVYYGNSSNNFAPAVVHIYDYAATNKLKTVHSLSGGSNNAAVQQGIFSRMGLWNSTNAVTSMVLTYNGGTGNILAGSQFALYGVKG